MVQENREPPVVRQSQKRADREGPPEVYAIVVECKDEAQQREMFERLKAEGVAISINGFGSFPLFRKCIGQIVMGLRVKWVAACGGGEVADSLIEAPSFSQGHPKDVVFFRAIHFETFHF